MMTASGIGDPHFLPDDLGDLPPVAVCVPLVLEGPDEDVRRMRMIPARSVSDVPGILGREAEGYIMPRGAALLPQLKSTN